MVCENLYASLTNRVWLCVCVSPSSCRLEPSSESLCSESQHTVCSSLGLGWRSAERHQWDAHLHCTVSLVRTLYLCFHPYHHVYLDYWANLLITDNKMKNIYTGWTGHNRFLWEIWGSCPVVYKYFIILTLFSSKFLIIVICPEVLFYPCSFRCDLFL